MGLPGAAGRGSRLDEAKGILLNGPMPLLKSLTERFNIKLYGLGESLRSLETEDLAGLKAGGKEGDLAEAIDRLADKHSMAVLFSDGNLKWRRPLKASSSRCRPSWRSERVQRYPDQGGSSSCHGIQRQGSRH